MGIDKFDFTTFKTIDTALLHEIGEVVEDKTRKDFYKYFCALEYAQVMWKPHRFGEDTNFKCPYLKIAINPKYFENFISMLGYIKNLLGVEELDLRSLNVSRLDVKADVDGLPMDVVLSRLHATGFRRESLSFYKSSIYIGSNPKIRAYDKSREIIYRLRKGKEVLDWEREINSSGKQVTRFEIQLRHTKKTLWDIANDPVALVSHFDRLKFYNFEDDGKIANMGGLQLLMSKVSRKHRQALEKFRDHDLDALVRQNFTVAVSKWFGIGEPTIIDNIQF